MKPPWTITVPLYPDESLSSWLSRAALRQGCDPIALTGAIWPHIRAWTRDTDRGFTPEDYRILSQVSGIPIHRFINAALRVNAEQIAGKHLKNNIIWPWILALGSRNRLRRGGQQFCPLCLADDINPYYRKKWRFGWHTTCQTHKINLVDQCKTCGSPIEFHRILATEEHLALCARCKFDLRYSEITFSHSNALEFQEFADEIVLNNGGMFGNKPVNAADWFISMRFFWGIIRRASRRGKSKIGTALRLFDIESDISLLPQTGLAFELLPRLSGLAISR